MDGKQKLIIDYVDALIEYNSNGKKIDEALYSRVLREIFEEKDLKKLLDFYIFVVKNEAIGAHENIEGDVKKEISNFQSYNKTIAGFYEGIKNTLFHRIEDGLINATPEQQKMFFEYLGQVSENTRTSLLAHKNIKSKYETGNVFEEKRLPDLVEGLGYTKQDAMLEDVYEKNYLGREIMRDTAVIEAVSYLLQNLGKKEAKSR